jgi:hypothetical protein
MLVLRVSQTIVTTLPPSCLRHAMSSEKLGPTGSRLVDMSLGVDIDGTGQ